MSSEQIFSNNYYGKIYQYLLIIPLTIFGAIFIWFFINISATQLYEYIIKYIFLAIALYLEILFSCKLFRILFRYANKIVVNEASITISLSFGREY
jgi:hypothetical protein